MAWTKQLREVGLADVPGVGGKNASLGELLQMLGPLGVNVPDGFAVTAEAYRYFLDRAGLVPTIRRALDGVEKDRLATLLAASESIRETILRAPLPRDLVDEIELSYRALSRTCCEEATDVAVRSSATAEDLPNASFAGQQETFLNVRGATSVVEAVKKAFASLFTPRAIRYREDMGFDHMSVAVSVGVQKMVRADRASAGVIFTLDPDTGHRAFVLVTSSWGLGESIVQGQVVPDQFWVHKPTLKQGFPSIVRRRCGTKEARIVYDQSGHAQTKAQSVPSDERVKFSLADDDVLTLARWAVQIEDHYAQVRATATPMDIEWAKDGLTGELFIVQARPETVHSTRTRPMARVYTIGPHGAPIVTGLAVGEAIATGKARRIRDPKDLDRLEQGEILLTEATDPDWEPIMKRASAIITDRGGRTSHAAIVARELGVPAIVGTMTATSAIEDGAVLTASCAEGESGRVYAGKLDFSVEEIDPSKLERPRTKIMLNVGDPEQALRLALLPSDGVGLARMEFIFASWVGVHPLALIHPERISTEDRREVEKLTARHPTPAAYFVDRLSQGIATIASAFYPRPVVLRFSDFKTNEYARLLGGAPFEPQEENPMLGWRGASRYYHQGYKEGFLLECAAVKRVRDELGLTNLELMIPFCRTPEEGERVIQTMRGAGLVRGDHGLEIWVMAEIPSNIILAERFATVFDGFSIGSNDLTQLTLGVDRDSTTVAPLFDERNESLRWSCARLIELAHSVRTKVSICGQAPSDYPELAAFLVEHGIDSLSLNADALVRTTVRILEVERTVRETPLPPRSSGYQREVRQ